MAYVPAGFTEEQEKLVLSRQEKIEAHVDEIIARQKTEESRRRWTLLFAVVGGVFAAVRLGVIAFPLMKKRKARLGQLGE
jgi:cyclopropane fatty-acyl-phospholipid synthase-like methyltransferase